jgi:hypothetical protein
VESAGAVDMCNVLNAVVVEREMKASVSLAMAKVNFCAEPVMAKAKNNIQLN